MIKLPFVTRKSYLELVTKYNKLAGKYERDRGIVAYIPQDNQNPGVGTNLSHHDKRIGWVQPMKFATYDDYLKYMRENKK